MLFFTDSNQAEKFRFPVSGGDDGAHEFHTTKADGFHSWYTFENIRPYLNGTTVAGID